MHLPIVPIWIWWIQERWLIHQRTIPHNFSPWSLVENSSVILIFIFFFRHSKIRKNKIASRSCLQGCAGTPEVVRAGQLTAAILDFLPICQSLIIPQICVIFFFFFLGGQDFFFSKSSNIGRFLISHVKFHVFWGGFFFLRQFFIQFLVFFFSKLHLFARLGGIFE